jgi:hypothetical protein
MQLGQSCVKFIYLFNALWLLAAPRLRIAYKALSIMGSSRRKGAEEYKTGTLSTLRNAVSDTTTRYFNHKQTTFLYERRTLFKLMRLEKA